MAPRKKTTGRGKKPKITGTCGQCKNCTYRKDFHTLSLEGKPILGTCPHWTKSRSVLLSYDTCDKFEPRNEEKGI